MSKAYLHHLITVETVAAHGKLAPTTAPRIPNWHILFLEAVTQHNIVFQAQVMSRARDAIMAGTFPAYLRSFFGRYFAGSGYPRWCVDALRSVGVDLLEGLEDAKVVDDNGAKWEYAGSK